MFKRDHHMRIATVLQSLDAQLLLDHGCYFGGGTAITLANGEYRESVDIDFLVSDQVGYRKLRTGLTGEKGISFILKPSVTLNLAREIRADQYGLRTMLSVGDFPIKFEIVLEGRIKLDIPSERDHICDVATLSTLDLATSKILANSDRWADDSVYSRDLIDLAMLQLPAGQLKKALAKATEAYGETAEKDLIKAIEKLNERSGRLSECMRTLKINELPEVSLWNHIRSLKKKIR